LIAGELLLQRKPNIDDENFEGASNNDVVIVLDCNTNPQLIKMGAARDIASKV